MTAENRQLLNRINKYAETVLGDIDPQKVQISVQLEKLKPIMQEIAAETHQSLEEIFILYMDLQSEAGVENSQKLKEEMDGINGPEGLKSMNIR